VHKVGCFLQHVWVCSLRRGLDLHLYQNSSGRHNTALTTVMRKLQLLTQVDALMTWYLNMD
jgi:hypothetical protein